MRLLKTIGKVDFTGQERAALNKLTMPHRGLSHSASRPPTASSTSWKLSDYAEYWSTRSPTPTRPAEGDVPAAVGIRRRLG